MLSKHCLPPTTNHQNESWPRLYHLLSDRLALLLRFTSLLNEVMILKEPSPQLVTKLLGTEEYEKENSRSECDWYSLGIRRFCSASLFSRCVMCCLRKSSVTAFACKVPHLQSKTSSSALLLTFTTHTQHEKREIGNTKCEVTGAIFFFHKWKTSYVFKVRINLDKPYAIAL